MSKKDVSSWDIFDKVRNTRDLFPRAGKNRRVAVLSGYEGGEGKLGFEQPIEWVETLLGRRDIDSYVAVYEYGFGRVSLTHVCSGVSGNFADKVDLTFGEEKALIGKLRKREPFDIKTVVNFGKRW